MIEKKVMESLYNDICRLKLPPISEKVFQALDEKRKQNMEMNKELAQVKKLHKSIPTKYVFAAMLAIIAVSVPIIIVLTNKAPISDLPDSPVLPSSSETVSISESQVTSAVENETALERIKLTQIYGEVALSGRSEKELETLLVTYSTKDSVYEDDRYIYNFDLDGSLVEILNKTHSAESCVRVTKKEIEITAKNIFEMYFAERDITSYKQEIISNTDTLPEWIINYKNNNDETIRMTFDKSGQLRMVIVIGIGDDFGNISKAQAVEIALAELKKEGYGFIPFKNKDVDILVEFQKRENKTYYCIVVDKIPRNELTFMSVYITMDTQTGNILNVEY